MPTQDLGEGAVVDCYHDEREESVGSRWVGKKWRGLVDELEVIADRQGLFQSL